METRKKFEDIANLPPGTPILLRARIHHIRPLSARVAFIVLRQRLSTLQSVLVEREGEISKNMVKWCERLETESVVIVRGKLQKPNEATDKEVKSTTFHNVEILIESVR